MSLACGSSIFFLSEFSQAGCHLDYLRSKGSLMPTNLDPMNGPISETIFSNLQF